MRCQTYESKPCRRCNGTARYASDRSCVGCKRAAYEQFRVERHPLYVTWRGMLARCTQPRATDWHLYGGRGVRVAPAWLGWPAGFERFVADVEATIGPRPSPQHTLDRVDPTGNYEPANLRWATPVEQTHNTRKPRTGQVVPHLSDDERARAVELAASGWTQVAIAAALGRSRLAIRRCVRAAANNNTAVQRAA